MNKILEIVPEDAEKSLVFFVNGKKVVESAPDPEWTLLWYLRRKLQLTGTKYGCGEGGCGACTVMVSQYLKQEDRVKNISVNACLMPVCAMHGLAVTTVEGIGSTQDRLHPVQERLAKAHGSQCGFCTPGIVMSMYTLLRNKNKIEYKDIEKTLQGNLCRCTGYRPIIEGFKTFMESWEQTYAKLDSNDGLVNGCAMGKDCCRNKKSADDDNPQLFNKSTFQPYDPTQEPIFPPELKLNDCYAEAFTFYQGDNTVWVRPKTLEELLKLKKEIPESKIVVGNTEVGVEIKFKKKAYPVLIYPSLIKEMRQYQVTDKGVVVGAATSLTDLHNFLQKEIKKDTSKGKVFIALKDMLHWFAGDQVRNVASLVGNIVTASPISDLNPILMSCSAVLNVCSLERGSKNIKIDSNFFKGYRRTALKEDEVVISVEIPFTESKQFVKAYKQARRKDDDISIVTAAFNVILEDNSNIVKEAKLCYGGMAPTTICAKKSSEVMIGKQWNEDLVNIVFDSLTEELQLDSSVPGGMAAYRKSLSLSMFYRYFLHIMQSTGAILKEQISGATDITTKPPISSQYFEIINEGRKSSDAVGKPIPHASGIKHTTGEAVYCDDIPQVTGELYLTLVFSKEAHAKIISIDPSKALEVPGVVAFFSAADLDDDCNKMGPIFKDEEIFSRHTVTSRSCVIGAVVATSESIARKAKELVSVTYEKIEPAIITLEEAIACNSFFDGFPRTLIKGNVTKKFETASHIKEGYVRTGAQEHFYLETMSAFAVRKEDELEIVATSQNPADIAHIAAETLRIPNHKVVAKVKRVGGGFGGKETRATVLAIPVAVAAYKLKKPVRAVFDRDEDMQVTGYRHPSLIKYRVAFDDDGRIEAAVFDIYSNAGNYMDISCAMMERALTHVDNCYYIPNIEVNGYLCKTNTPSNTAFRGFGAPKAMLAAEAMIRDIASALNKTYEEIAFLNLYREGHFTHYGQELTYCTLSSCLEECIETSDYWERKKSVEEFNRLNRWKKKGLALVPTKYGISFQVDILMQAGALLLVYYDGSVLLSIGGIEMGQGLFTKMIQVTSRALEVDISKIHISEMATDKVPNSQPTAGSISSDLYGMAVINACNILKERLQPFKAKNPDGKWEDWVSAAYVDRVNLSASGFYAAPKIEYNRDTNSGNLFEYFTYGAGCSEVIIDCLTGDHQVLRTDIVMDLGESLNPAIDIGQIEGAFTQGYGFYTMEEMIFSPNGEVLSRGPGAYKIPGFSDIPKEFNVSLLKGAPNPRAVYSSKAVGEPPLFLAASVFFAIKDAIKSARIDAGMSPEFTLEVPATCARIRMACEDHITKQMIPGIRRYQK
ncbi:molybdopterin-binding domain of aldehyde dehydrogenase domain-containing protein [Phthorimaea operculella]|nr:molybdopterin-binding domain of aldehyde dehydrogenase domain-containing protein [Phthorimaea operculella]